MICFLKHLESKAKINVYTNIQNYFLKINTQKELRLLLAIYFYKIGQKTKTSNFINNKVVNINFKNKALKI
jgi:hypothetical protein